MTKKGKSKPGGKKRENKCIVTFNEADRHEYLTGFHKRKVERRKAAMEELKNKLKEEEKRVKEERHKEYMKMLKERNEALEEADELESLVTSRTESLQYDFPNHTVTVTTVSNLDLSAASRLGPVDAQATEEKEDEMEETVSTVPKKAGAPLLSKRLSSLTASLHARTKKRKKRGAARGREKSGRCRGTDRTSGPAERKSRPGRTTKRQRRRRTGRNTHEQD